MTKTKTRLKNWGKTQLPKQTIKVPSDIMKDVVEKKIIENKTSVPDIIREYGPLFCNSGEKESTGTNDSAKEFWVPESAFVDVFGGMTGTMSITAWDPEKKKWIVTD